MNLFPFSYRITAGGDIMSGILFDTPKFCCTNKNNPKCKRFYQSLKKTGIYQCPYGFGVEVLDWAGKNIIFTCLNVEKISDRNSIRKHLKTSEFYPRISTLDYQRYKDSFTSIISENKNAFDLSVNNTIETEKLKEKKELLENTIHEIRKLNTQLKGVTSKLTAALSNIRNLTDYIESLNLDVYSISNLMTIRLDTYDLEVNPELNLDAGKKPIAIYKKIEKVYKCLRGDIQKKNLNVKLEGQSHNSFNANNLIEIAFFIILDNAIKYSPKGKDIIITFNEKEDSLQLKFNNFGLRPSDEEKKLLFNRGQRGKIAIEQDIEGRGLGLYLLHQICASNNVELKLDIGTENYYENGIRYSPFIVKLFFRKMIIPYEE